VIFNSLLFLYLFLPITYFVFWRLKTKNARYIWLTAASYVFYGYWNYKFCFLMLFSTVVSYGAGLGFLRYSDEKHRKFFLIAPIAVDLLLLGFFKYTNFFLHTLESVFDVQGLPMLNIILPVGISFYTFHTISYIVDSYRGVIKPTNNFFEFSCYVSLFPQLVAGPIVRFRQIEADLENIDHANRSSFLTIGWSFFILGLIKKVLIADSIAMIIDPAFRDVNALSSLSAWVCMLGYTYQLYFDFSGYSDMAVGLGYLFGLRLPQNFNSPYRAVNIADFWKRWHISLSTCLRDYVYIPLGGNRGNDLFVSRNLLLTMLIGGLWHGANWTFVFWGFYHGLLLLIHRKIEPVWSKLPLFLQRVFTFLLVLIGWVFFRCETFAKAVVLLQKMFTAQPGLLLPGFWTATVALAIAAFVAHRGPNSFELDHKWKPWQTVALSFLFLLCLLSIYGNQESPFLYFQF